jgi:hypothetical protein
MIAEDQFQARTTVPCLSRFNVKGVVMAGTINFNQSFKVLLNFSLGRINDTNAMVALDIDSDEDLFLLMWQAHLPMPRLPAAKTQAMVNSLHALLP